MVNSVNQYTNRNQNLVIIPPDNHYKPILYSHVQADKDFANINRDIYQGMQKSKSLNRKKTPLSIKILAGAGAMCGVIYGIAKLIRR